MAETKQQQIIDAVIARFQGITIGNGYYSNLGQNITEWRNIFTQDEMVGSIYDTALEPDADGAIGQFRWALEIELDVIVPGSTSNADMRKVLFDVLKAIFNNNGHTWDGLAQRTEQPSIRRKAEHNERLINGAQVSFRIIYDAPKGEI